MTIKSAPRSIEERANDLATVFTMRPKILKGMHLEQWEGLYLNYAVWQLLGRVAPEKCMPGFAGLGVMSSATATHMLSSYVKHQRDLVRCRGLGRQKAAIMGVEEAARRAWLCITRPSASTSSLNFLIRLCIAIFGCRCFIESVCHSGTIAFVAVCTCDLGCRCLRQTRSGHLV